LELEIDTIGLRRIKKLPQSHGYLLSHQWLETTGNIGGNEIGWSVVHWIKRPGFVHNHPEAVRFVQGIHLPVKGRFHGNGFDGLFGWWNNGGDHLGNNH
jgi:hypothetical protein